MPAPIRWLRTRPRKRGADRWWWEPSKEARAAGFEIIELDATRPGWSEREARRLNGLVDRALTGQPMRGEGARTIGALAQDYLHSRRFAKRAEATKASYRQLIRVIVDKWGGDLARDFTKPVMNAWYDTLLGTGKLTQAERLKGMMSILMSHAEVLGWRPENSNPCFHLGGAGKPRRGRIATWAEFDQLKATALARGEPHMALAMALSMFQGQRATDIRAAAPADFHLIDHPQMGRVWIWALTRQKRGTAGVMGLHEEVVPLLAEARMRAGEDQATLIVHPGTGRPYAQNEFSAAFRRIRTAAARTMPSLLTPTLQFRDLRRTFGAMARGSGSSKEDIGDVLGNSVATDPALEAIYMPPQFETATRAVHSIRRPK